MKFELMLVSFKNFAPSAFEDDLPDAGSTLNFSAARESRKSMQNLI